MFDQLRGEDAVLRATEVASCIAAAALWLALLVVRASQFTRILLVAHVLACMAVTSIKSDRRVWMRLYAVLGEIEKEHEVRWLERGSQLSLILKSGRCMDSLFSTLFILDFAVLCVVFGRKGTVPEPPRPPNNPDVS